MSKKVKIIDESSDSELDLKVNEDYANKYNTWRQKEELQKLKDRYGDNPNEESSSSSSESEDEEVLSAVIDKEFLKTLSCLKRRAPEIYDKEIRFFPSNDGPQSKPVPNKKRKKKEPMFLKDYERKIILEKDGILSDEDKDEGTLKRPHSPSYIQEQNDIKKSFKTMLEDTDSEEEILQQKTKLENEKNIDEDPDWLYVKGGNSAKDKSTEKELKYLKEYWNNPKLDESEAFLRDYILNKDYIDKDDKEISNFDEIDGEGVLSISEDEKLFEQQEDFEHKFNFRFEEPDEEFIKRFPRTMNNTLRRKDPKRKKQREEYRERKKEEKEKKKEELKRLKALKRKEIATKLDHLKEITGNQKLGFDDLEEDFDPDKYDNRMKEVFDEDYYGDVDEEGKPIFPYDEEIDDNENWDSWKGNNNNAGFSNEDLEQESHCEDPNFNMDADYDRNNALKKELVNSSRKSKRKSKFAEILSKKKPVFDPNDKSFEEYLDEYYKLDFEDIVGDMPVRFPYRSTLPNDFGLSVEEVLAAHDKELNQWASLKKTCQYRTEEEEKYDVQAFKKKAQSLTVKQKIIPSLFKTNEGEESIAPKRKRKRKKNQNLDAGGTKNDKVKINNNMASEHSNERGSNCNEGVLEKCSLITKIKPLGLDGKMNQNVSQKKKTKSINRLMLKDESVNGLQVTDERLKAYGINPKKFKNKFKHGKK